MTLITQALARIEEILKRAEAATPGPWRMTHDAQGPNMVFHPTREGVAIASLTDAFKPVNGFHEDWDGDNPPVTIAERNANTALIAAARTDLPALCAVVKALLQDFPVFATEQEAAALKAFVEAR